MHAQVLLFTHLLDGAKQFIVPIFQRDYSWGTKHCLQLWNDLIRVGSDPNAKEHFLGSVVYISAEETGAGITRWLLIDGQQRITTLTLLLTALRNQLLNGGNGANQEENGLPSPEELDDYFLHNRHGKGDRKYKLCLRRSDQQTLGALVDVKDTPTAASERISENFKFFEEKLAEANLEIVHSGISKLAIVDVCLTRGQDDPQMIFESLNSTGLDLTQADLIRNFVLMRQVEDSQTRLYTEYWQPIEVGFGARYRTDFDKFVRDYLTLKLRPSKQLKADEIYQHFRTYFYEETSKLAIEDILANLKRFGIYYVAHSLGREKDPTLKDAFRRLRLLVEVASPVVLRLYDCFERLRTLSAAEFIEAIELMESYVFRRSVCDMQTRSLGQIFSSLAYRIKDDQPLNSLRVALYRQGRKRRFPTDAEFREALETRDVYDMRTCYYLLDRLENFSKEKIDTSTFTIEHILPQNEDLRPEWRQMLGPDWKQIQETWLHRLGNITLTGYNSEYSDRSFEEKKSIKDGFAESPLRLNKFVREQTNWSALEIERRGKDLAAKALAVWRALVVDMEAVKDAELEYLKARAAKYGLDTLAMDERARAIFDVLRPQILGMGDDVIELFSAKSATYRVYDFFVEVIPRKQRLSLLLNIDFSEVDDPSEKASDASENAFIIYASEEGGVLFSLEDDSEIPAALHVIRQAYERVAE
jgi:uncharacterized protein with ParB-like and HNH nuclease domain/predicted transport protein